MRLVDAADGHIYFKAFVNLVGPYLWCEDDSYGQDVVNFVEGDMLRLHLVPYRVWTFDPCFQLIVNAHGIKGLLDGRREQLEEAVTLLLCEGKLVGNVGVFFGMLEPEAEVFQFGLNLIQAQSVRQWRIYI